MEKKSLEKEIKLRNNVTELAFFEVEFDKCFVFSTYEKRKSEINLVNKNVCCFDQYFGEMLADQTKEYLRMHILVQQKRFK